MKIRTLLLAAVLLMGSLSTLEAKKKTADPYRQKVMEVVFGENDIESLTDQVSQQLSSRLDSIPAKTKKQKKLMKYFADGTFVEDFVSLYDDVFRGRLTEAELDELIAYNMADSTKLLQQKAVQWAQNLQDPSSKATAAIMQMTQTMVSVLQGQEAKMELPAVDPAYEQLFHAYYNASGTDRIMESYMQNIFGAILGQLGGAAQQEELKPFISKMQTFMADYLEPTVMNMMDGIYTADDFRYYISHMTTPTYQKYVEATSKADLGAWLNQLVEMFK